MSTYRVGNHHGVTIVREGDGARCGRPGHDCDRGHLVGVMFTAEDAALAVEALNGHHAVSSLEGHGYDVVLVPRPCPTCTGPTRETVGMVCQTCGTDYGPTT